MRISCGTPTLKKFFSNSQGGNLPRLGFPTNELFFPTSCSHQTHPRPRLSVCRTPGRQLYAISPHVGRATGQDIHGHCAVLNHDQWSSILSEFPSVLKPNFHSSTNKHGRGDALQLVPLHTYMPAIFPQTNLQTPRWIW